MTFTVPPVLIGIAGAILGVILILSLLGLFGEGKEGSAVTKVALVGLVLLLFIDGITMGPITTAIGNKIAELISQI